MAGLLQQNQYAEQWRDWAQGKTRSPPAGCKPALSFFRLYRSAAAWEKRRRWTNDAAWNLADQYPESVPVYVSHDGESNHSFSCGKGAFEHAYRIADLHSACPFTTRRLGNGRTCQDMSEHTALAVAADSLKPR